MVQKMAASQFDPRYIRELKDFRLGVSSCAVEAAGLCEFAFLQTL